MKRLGWYILTVLILFVTVFLAVLAANQVVLTRSQGVTVGYWIDDEFRLVFQREYASWYNGKGSSVYLLHKVGTESNWDDLVEVPYHGVAVHQDLSIVMIEEEGDFERNHQNYYGLVCVPDYLQTKKSILDYVNLKERLGLIEDFESEPQKIDLPCY